MISCSTTLLIENRGFTGKGSDQCLSTVAQVFDLLHFLEIASGAFLIDRLRLLFTFFAIESDGRIWSCRKTSTAL